MATQNQLVSACLDGDLSVIQQCLNCPFCSADAVQEGFFAACCKGHVDAMQLMLAVCGELAVNVHGYGEGLLVEVCHAGQEHILRERLSLDGDRTVDCTVAECAALVAASDDAGSGWRADGLRHPHRPACVAGALRGAARAKQAPGHKAGKRSASTRRRIRTCSCCCPGEAGSVAWPKCGRAVP